MKVLYLIATLAFMAFVISPCSAQRKGKDSKDILSDEYYTQLGSNLERLHKLRIGVFVQYNQDSSGNLHAWKFNDGEDSVLLYTVAVGSPNKDGYWVYHHQFISNLPDMPIYTAFEHIVPVTRDSFVGHFYKCQNTYSLNDLLDKKDIFSDINLKDLEEMTEKVYYWKVDFTEFHAFSVPYFQNARDEEEERYTIDFYKITKNHMRFNATQRNGVLSLDAIRKLNPPDNFYRTFLVRFYPENVSLFAEGNRKRGK